MARGGSAAKRKGDRAEREIAKMFGAERSYWQPEQEGETKKPDLYDIPYLGRCEVKIRSNGFKQLYDWLSNNAGLFVRADRRPWIVIMPAQDFKAIIDELDAYKGG